MTVKSRELMPDFHVPMLESLIEIREGGIQLSKEDVIRVDGVVEDISSNIFNVTLTNGQTIRASLAGKLRIHHIRILPGDKVTVELSPYDLTNGRIVYRNK